MEIKASKAKMAEMSGFNSLFMLGLFHMFTYDLCFDTSEILLPVMLPQVLHNCSPGIGTL